MEYTSSNRTRMDGRFNPQLDFDTQVHCVRNDAGHRIYSSSCNASSVTSARCPLCASPGPNDVHVSHRALSVIVVTQVQTRPIICCQRCGNQQKLVDSLFSLAFGWWAFPWGFITTPVQVARNLYALWRPETHPGPSAALQRMIQAQLASRALESEQQIPRQAEADRRHSTP